ncbi:MAG: nuclear transport factor 2 family protein [Myxococcales bacterium]|nr:nuclear transport factor 2 family protein [Myxococcales bacterium]
MLRAPLALLSAALIALTLVTACGEPRAPASTAIRDDDRRAIAALLDDQRQAWNAGDLDTFMAAYVPTEELVFTSGGAIRRGWETTRARYRQRYGDDPSTMGELAFEVLEIQSLGADGAIVLGRWSLEKTPEAGAGVFSLALRRTPAGWRIVHDHTSLATPE